jgi:hypothetical protein
MERYASQRPTFNVCEPFLGVYVIQLNAEMKDLLLDVLSEFGELEKELYAFKRSLENPTASRERREIKKRRVHGDAPSDDWPDQAF